jgi:hypothetical protein
VLEAEYDASLSKSAFKFNLRRYCLVADDGREGAEMVGTCDLTLLPAGGLLKTSTRPMLI